MNTSELTRGQVERTISQRIQALYRERLGHQPSKVTCELFEDKLTIVLENSITPAEQLLLQEGKEDSVEQLRSDLDEVIRPQLKAELEEILGISVLDLLSDATLETGRMGLIAVLESAPSLRSGSRKNRG
ncbi:MAG TPA: DUF2294 domain-containing protein [Oscillatoriales cyanobacterium M59_W2019_021]|nr:MAG: DUF2294 domain-containing protein [Cyanobacteria bacterium J055]HIK32201.1 DUF2294 domain-containing protein [Oscillatoriales cyanobacterium M4454_W2019_049]HIK50879.1 DUF2294 domain-containing protein [Oscillatoriales cyanobacterium M59_W2019_021]